MSEGLCPLLPEEGHDLDGLAVQGGWLGPWDPGERPWALMGHGPPTPAFAIRQPPLASGGWSWLAPEGPLPTSQAPEETGEGGQSSLELKFQAPARSQTHSRSSVLQDALLPRGWSGVVSTPHTSVLSACSTASACDSSND